MKKLIFLLFCALFFTASASAHTAFRLISIEKKTLSDLEITRLQKAQSVGKIDGSNLTYTGASEIRLIVVTGPEDDMLSYRIQGVRNPNFGRPGRRNPEDPFREHRRRYVLLSPMIASAAMTFSSVSVIANALRLRSVQLEPIANPNRR